MAVIMTKRNMVAAYEAQDGDCIVHTLIGAGPALAIQSIENYQDAVDWAVSMADYFEYPIHVVPLDVTDMFHLYRERLERGLAAMNPEQRFQLRRTVVKAMVEVMRDCDEHPVRTEAYDVLVKMKVVQ